MEHLGNQSTGNLVLKALRELPSDLNSTYASIMARIPKENRSFAKEAMLWLSFAYRPLKLAEVCETFAINDSSPTVSQGDRILDTHSLLKWCQGLVTYHPGTSDLSLSHSSVRTYLLSDQITDGVSSFFSIDETVAERLLLRKCLTYMMFTDFAGGYCSTYYEWKEFSGRWPLLSYAAQYWAAHAHALDARLESYDRNLISKFCSRSESGRGSNFGFWVQCLSPTVDTRIARDTQPLYYAASYGLRTVVSSLISADMPVDIDAVGGRVDWTALQVASFRGHYGVAKDLLDAGANPYLRDHFGRSALFYALCRGHNDTAELLRQNLRARSDPKGEAAATHIQDAFATARKFLDRKGVFVSLYIRLFACFQRRCNQG